MYALRLLERHRDYYSSPVYSLLWCKGWMEAKCDSIIPISGLVPHDPEEGCSLCGFHAVTNFDQLLKEFTWMDSTNKQYHLNYPMIPTLCEFAGKIIVGEIGLRAQYARIIGIVDWKIEPAPLRDACYYFRVPFYTQDEAIKVVRASMLE